MSVDDPMVEAEAALARAAEFSTPGLDAWRATLPTAKTSDLFGWLFADGALDAVIEHALGGHDAAMALDRDTLTMAAAAVVLAISAEVDARIPPRG